MNIEDALISKEGTKLSLIKYSNGNAYYFALRGWQNSPTVVIYHALSGEKYIAFREKIVNALWDLIPLSYQVDIITYDVMNLNLKEKLASVLTSVTPKIPDAAKWISGNDIFEAIKMQFDQKGFPSVLVRQFGFTEGGAQAVASYVGHNYASKTVGMEFNQYTGYARTYTDISSVEKAFIDAQHKTSTSDANAAIGVKIPQSNYLSNQSNSTTMDLTKSINFKFGKVEGRSDLALSMLGIAIFANGSYKSFNQETQELVDVGEFIFKGDIYQIPTKDLIPGDVILHENSPVFVTVVNADGSIEAVTHAGFKVSIVKRTNILNLSFHTKLVSMFSMLSGNKGAGNMGNPFGSDFNPMMLMFMGQSGAGSTGGNSIFEAMMLSNLLGGSANSLFATPGKKPRPARARKRATRKRK
jgi:hypothetical protein